MSKWAMLWKKKFILRILLHLRMRRLSNYLKLIKSSLTFLKRYFYSFNIFMITFSLFQLRLNWINYWLLFLLNLKLLRLIESWFYLVRYRLTWFKEFWRAWGNIVWAALYLWFNLWIHIYVICISRWSVV